MAVDAGVALSAHPTLASLLDGSDHADVKSVRARKDLAAFVAGMFNWQPWWLAALFAMRAGLVRFLGMKQAKAGPRKTLSPADVSFTAGDHLGFFTVYAAVADRYHVSVVAEKHLAAYMAVIVENEDTDGGGSKPNRSFHIVTIVKYLHWTGPLYFNLIRPFHYMVVRQMARAAAADSK